MISSYTLGNDLLQAYKQGKNPTVTSRLRLFEPRFLKPGDRRDAPRRPQHVVVVGAHRDSVTEGPGINDDGSGTATLLAQAEELSRGRVPPATEVRFVWLGAEENGLVGSIYYART